MTSAGSSNAQNTDTGKDSQVNSGNENMASSGTTGTNQNNADNTAVNDTAVNSTNTAGSNNTTNTNAEININTEKKTNTDTNKGADSRPVTGGAVTVDSQNALSGQDFSVEESEQETETTAFMKPSVTIEMDDTTILTAEKLQMAKEQNFALELDMGNQAVWNIDVSSADMDALTAVDLGITFGVNDIPAELIDEPADGNAYLQFTLAHDGPFGFDAELTVALGAEYCGKYANLFYYNPERMELEFVCDSVIDAEGNACFDMEHASSYVIIISDQPLSGSVKSDGTNSIVKWIVAVIFLFMLLAAIGYAVFFVWKKKQKAEDGEENNKDEARRKGVEEKRKDLRLKSKEKSVIKKPVREREQEAEPETAEGSDLEKVDINAAVEDDWIEDKDWQEPIEEKEEKLSEPEAEAEYEERFANEPEEDDWIDDDEWDIGNDWIDDEEWERKNMKNLM